MEYKLLIVKNRFTGKLKLDRGLAWFKDKTPLEITTEEIVTDFDVTTKKVSNATYAGVICGEDIYPKLRTVVPEGKYHAVVFVYGNNLDGIRVNSSEAMPLYPGTDLVQLCTTNDGGLSLNHELFHTFFHRLQRQQVMIEDCMDSVVYNGQVQPYFNNKVLDANPSNRSIALERLAPHWDKVANILVLNKPTVAKYRYFSEKEVVGLKPELVQLLDKARDIADVPFIITSGYRTTEHNEDVGGVADSSHTKGLAIDLLIKDGVSGEKINAALHRVGINRFGYYKDGHLHCDIDLSKPNPTYWVK